MRLPTHRPPTHPGEMLRKEFLEPMRLTQVAAARRMKMPLTRLNEIVRKKRGISADTAWSLSELLGTTPQFWMNLQATWDLWHAREARQHRAA